MSRAYEFRSVWDVATPPLPLWDTLKRLLASDDPLPWWNAVTVTAHREDEIDLTARSVFGYELRFTVHGLELSRPDTMSFSSRGDLEGEAALSFAPGAAGRTQLTIDWHVDATRPWMRRSAPVLRPVFVLAHGLVMRSGRRRFNRWLVLQG